MCQSKMRKANRILEFIYGKKSKNEQLLGYAQKILQTGNLTI